MKQLILVDENDNPIGAAEKMEAHEKALLHRAFSVFIFNSNGQMLLQQRSKSKYHSGGLWTNACCSHPYVGEETLPAAEKRLLEEMGFSTTLTKAFDFVYKANFDNGLTEYEFDHVYIGNYNGEILPNESEVEDYCYMDIDKIKSSIASHPDKYTEWFKIAFAKIESFLAVEELSK